MIEDISARFAESKKGVIFGTERVFREKFFFEFFLGCSLLAG